MDGKALLKVLMMAQRVIDRLDPAEAAAAMPWPLELRILAAMLHGFIKSWFSPHIASRTVTRWLLGMVIAPLVSSKALLDVLGLMEKEPLFVTANVMEDTRKDEHLATTIWAITI